MAVSNTIAAPVAHEKKELTFKFKAGDNDITLSPSFVKSFLVTGDSEKVTDSEVMMFIKLCQHQKLNPFLREAYLIKYGSNAAQLVVGKAAFEARADRDERYEGYDAGIVVQKKDGTAEYRKGTLVFPDEKLVGGWADIYVKGMKTPVHSAVSLSEYSSGKSTWAQKPATMIRKVAKMQALREAFPNAFSGMYTADEMGGDSESLPQQPIPQPEQKPEPVIVEPESVEVLDGSDLL